MKKYLFAIIAVLLAVVAVLCVYVSHLRDENSRIKSNNVVLSSQLDTFRTKLGESAAMVDRLSLTLGEFRQQNQELNERIKMLDLRLRRINSYSINGYQSSVTFTVPLTIASAMPGVSVERRFLWSDTWNRVEGVVASDSVKCSVVHKDTIDQIIYRVPRKFLFIRWGTKKVSQIITLRDTNSAIVYSRYIELQKKR